MNLFAPKATEYHCREAGSVLAVQVTPSGDVAAAVDGPPAIATKALFP